MIVMENRKIGMFQVNGEKSKIVVLVFWVLDAVHNVILFLLRRRHQIKI